MIVSLGALKAGLKTMNSGDILGGFVFCFVLGFFCFKYFISQPRIIHWINAWAAPFGKRLAVRTFSVFLLERRPLMLGALFLQHGWLWDSIFSRERLFGWEQLLLASPPGRDLVPCGLGWAETLLQGSAAAGAGPEQNKQEWETLLARGVYAAGWHGTRL